MFSVNTDVVSGDFRVEVGGVKTTRMGLVALTNFIISKASAVPRTANTLLCFDINGHGLAMYRFDRSYRASLDEADIIHADGEPLVVATKLMTATSIEDRSA